MSKHQENIRLYNGEVELIYKQTAKSHSYWVDGRKVMGTTTPLSVVSKPALLWWSANVAVDYVADKWLPGKSYDELYIRETLDAARKEHNQKKEKAGTKGSLVHDSIHNYIKFWLTHGHTNGVAEPYNEDVKQRYLELVNWLHDHEFKPIATERKVFSRKHWIAGTLDTEGIMGRSPTLIDFKNSSGIWPEMKLQLCCYAHLRYEESQIIYPNIWIVRIGDDGEIEDCQIPWEDTFKHFEAFLHAKALYDWQTQVKKENKNENE